MQLLSQVFTTKISKLLRCRFGKLDEQHHARCRQQPVQGASHGQHFFRQPH